MRAREMPLAPRVTHIFSYLTIIPRNRVVHLLMANEVRQIFILIFKENP